MNLNYICFWVTNLRDEKKRFLDFWGTFWTCVGFIRASPILTELGVTHISGNVAHFKIAHTPALFTGDPQSALIAVQQETPQQWLGKQRSAS